jgi:type VI secretion system secreted protein VgrG
LTVQARKNGIEAAIEVDGESYTAVHLVFEEQLDEVPRLVARIARDASLPKPSSLLGLEAKASVGSVGALDAGRVFGGLVTEVVRRADARRPTLEVVVQPPLFKLAKRTNLRTFLQKSVVDILQQVFDGAGVPLRLELGQTYDTRPTVAQYREADLDFVRRLCSEEGIILRWDHATGEAVLFDDPEGAESAADATLPYIAEFGFSQPIACVQQVRRRHRVVTDKVRLRSYDFEKPRNLVEGEAESADDGAHALEVYAFPGGTVSEPTTKRWAKVLLDSVQATRDVFVGTATSLTLAPGQRFSIESHPHELMNAELFVTRTTLTFEDDASSIDEARLHTNLEFEAVPVEKTTYRPPRRPRRVAVPGLQVAKTTGASGQEIDVDEHGRVTVVYPWDREAATDDKSSVRMRTVQLPTGGSMLHPRVGWEVTVQSTEGDPDLPVVTARLYNGINTPPYALPGGAVRSSLQTATTPGGGSTNELRTDDTKGKEEMFFNASKDMTVMVKNNTTESVGNNATLKVGGNQALEITNSLTTVIGASQSVDVGGNQKIAVETFQVDDAGGSYSYSIGGNRDMKVGGDHRHTVTGSETVEVGGMKIDLVVGKVSESTDANLDLTVGAASVALTPADIALEVGGNQTETIGAAKVVLAFGGASSEVGGTSMKQMAAAKADLVDGDRVESAGAAYTSIAAGAQIVKADNIVIQADAAVTLVMGGSILSVTPASVVLLGASAKLDGATAETAALVIDN